MRKSVLILGGSGKIGQHSQRAFAQAAWQVRTFTRGEDMTAAAQGVDVIINGLNPPAYHDWDRQIPAITAQVIAAAKSSGATVIVPGNVYNLDALGGCWSELTKHAPPTRKGRIREEMEQAYRESGVQTIVLRAGNFIDPNRQGDVFSEVLLRAIQHGRITSPGDPRVQQAYAYVPDWCRAAVQFAERRRSLEPFEDIPFPGHSFSVEQLQMALGRELDRSLNIVGFPWWFFTLAAPVWELARELREMRYLWDLPHTLDDRKFNQLLPGFCPTPLPQILRASVPDHLWPKGSPSHNAHRAGREHESRPPESSGA